MSLAHKQQLRAPGPIVEAAHKRVRDMYAPALGRTRAELTTPALLLDLGILKANLGFMAEHMAEVPTTLRAHVKVHKSPHIARLEVEYGAIGVGCATVWEAIVMARAGIDDVFVINEVVGPEKTRALALLAREANVRTPSTTRFRSRSCPKPQPRPAAPSASSSTSTRACTAAESLLPRRRFRWPAGSRLPPGSSFVGLTGYEGHCSLEFDAAKRYAMAKEAMGVLTGVADHLAANGFPCEIVSAAGTGTWEVTSRYPGVTEIQPGSYATMDGHHRGLDPRFGWAVTVLASVISRRSDRIVLDAGNKTVGASQGILAPDGLKPFRFDEEHSIFLVDPSNPVKVGDRFEIQCNYTPNAIGYFEAYHVIENGRVTDIWPVMPRGPESRWLLDVLERGE